MSQRSRRFPEWLRKRLPPAGATAPVHDLIGELRLSTVCREAHCPNMGECFARGTATFMILGNVCTRNCGFCAVETGDPLPPDATEPGRIAEATARLGLRHVVITSVTRDDLADGGSRHFAETVRAVHRRTSAAVEVLTPDFGGREGDVDTVTAARPEVFNHNIETVPRLYPEVRPQADYGRSLAVLARAAAAASSPVVKSGMMLGLGEEEPEVLAALKDLRGAGCRVLTLGQYLSPSDSHLPVREYVTPETFRAFETTAHDLGFEAVASGPFVRSSYMAEQVAGNLPRRGPCRTMAPDDK
jgi:lipoic acid synthetase